MILFHHSKSRPGAEATPDAAHAGEWHRKLQAGGNGAGETLEGSNDLENYFPQKCRTHQSASKCALSLLQACTDSPLERSCCRADCWKVIVAERSISSCFFWNRDRKSKDIVFNPNPFIPQQGLSMAVTAALPRPIFSS